jgi:hypothetical protein
MESKDEGAKSPFSSKTLHFNWWTWVVWPFLPHKIKSNPNAILALSAWLTIGNVVLRFITTEALLFWGKNANKKITDKS